MKIFSSLFSLIPPPYGLLLHYGGMLLLIVSGAGFCYIKGVDHQQLIDQVATAKANEHAQASNLKRLQAMRPISTQFQEVHANDEASLPQTQSAISGFLGNDDGVRNCPAGKHAAAQVPGVRSEPAAKDADAGSDAGSRQTLTDDIAHDAALYGACQHQLDALIDTAIAAGANDPGP